jgi:hypothetical protein
MLLEEVRQVDIVACGRACTQPLRVADNQIVSVALGGELAERLGLEIGPRCGFHGNLRASLFLVVLDEFLQVIRRVPLRPENGQTFRRRQTAGQGENSAGQQAGP